MRILSLPTGRGESMKIPMVGRAAAALNLLYDDRARIVRRSINGNGRTVDEVVYSALKCHLSVQRGLGSKSARSFKQTEAEARAAESYQLYFPPGSDIKAGDLIAVTHCQAVMEGRAGAPCFGKLGVRVSLDGCIVL